MGGGAVMYALYGPVTKEILTHKGRPIVHDNKQEMEWMFPGVRVISVTDKDLANRSPLPPIQLRDHPDMASTTFPLKKEDFRDSS